MFGLKQLIELQLLERRDMIFFHYLGEGRFNIVIFDKTKVKKVFCDVVGPTCNIYVDSIRLDVYYYEQINININIISIQLLLSVY